ncbi:P-loop containing nucleoside triphosphate hydrolase protein [Roridomyces roridus]|uniref:P-loop containing nucleoside triphosphate hydrolase protein n=1 Tax=Roridomyces roridus TaxID=1738132 RepID=A0AAD7AX96_9AGAR|nr:P-loop containing nucleoside triphosphate hydrolase protein [Roridomyces roridus]
MQEYFSQEPKEIQRRIFVLHGPGGSGKTQVALKFIESLNDFTKQFFVNAGSLQALKTSFMNIAISQTFGKTAEAGLQWLISGNKEWTLLLDNADDSKLNLSPFFPQCTHGNIIITSRNPRLVAYAPAAHSQVGDLDEENAALLLLARAVKEDTNENHKLAVDIVQELSCLPLAIVQAGAYIAKFKCLLKYLSIYRQNKAKLLQHHSDQILDAYESTVYTTWQISFEKLSPVAARFLRLCALLHHSKIPESIFVNATQWILKNEVNETGSMQAARQFLQSFVSDSGSWQEQYLRNIVAEIEEYSLLERDERSETLSMHPLVHLWCSDTQPNQATVRACMINVLGMAIDCEPRKYLARIGLMSHAKMLVSDLKMIDSRFWFQYGMIYYDGGQFEQARTLYEWNMGRQEGLFGKDNPDTLTAMAHVAATYRRQHLHKEAEPLVRSVLEQCQKLLGNDHPETLSAMANHAANLAATYRQQGQYQEAEPLQVSVLEHRQNALGDDHPDTLSAMANLAMILHSTGRHQAAEKLLLKVVAKGREGLGADHPHTLQAVKALKATQDALAKAKDAESTGVNGLLRFFSSFNFHFSKEIKEY